MSYELKKPITDRQKADFIVEYNYNQGLRIKDGSDTYEQDNLTLKADFIFALEANEIMADVEVEIDVPDEVEEGQEITYHKETVIVHKPIIDPDYEQEQARREAERIANLNLTKADFWIALLDGGITKAMVKEKIELIPDEILKQKTLIRLDEADHFWRGDPSMDIIGSMFGLTPNELTYLFENKELPPKEE